MSVLSGIGSSALIRTARSTADVRLTTPDQAFDSDLYYGGSLLGTAVQQLPPEVETDHTAGLTDTEKPLGLTYPSYLNIQVNN